MIWLLGISAYLAAFAFVLAACKVAGDYDREFLGDDDMYREHGIYDDATVFCYPVRELAAAWRASPIPRHSCWRVRPCMARRGLAIAPPSTCPAPVSWW